MNLSDLYVPGFCHYGHFHGFSKQSSGEPCAPSPPPYRAAGPQLQCLSGTHGAGPQDLRLGVNPLLPSLRLRPCPPPAASRYSVCAHLSAENTCASFSTLLRPFLCGFSTAFGRWGAAAEGGAGRGGRGRGGVGAGWVGREPGGCGLAATLQLVAGDLVPPARPSDGGEGIRLDTHTRTQLGTSPGGSCPLRRTGGRAAAVTAPAAGSAELAQLGTGGSKTQEGKNPDTLTVALWGGFRDSRLPKELSPRTPEALSLVLRVRGGTGARPGRGGCTPPPAERLRAPALRELGLRRLPVSCPRCGSAPCRTWLESPGEVQETRPKLLYVLLARFLLLPAPRPGPRRCRLCRLRVGPARLLFSRAHAQPGSLARIHADSLSAAAKPGQPKLLDQLLPGLQEPPGGPA